MKEICSERNRRVICEKKDLIVGYFVAGYPDKESFFEVLREAKRAGVDIFEIGFPAADPVADGPVIREAMAQVEKEIVCSLDYWKQIREALDAPIWLMGYRADLLDTGKYLELAREKCFDGIVVPDIEETTGRELQEEMKEYGLDVVGMIGPNSRLSDSANCLSEFPIIYQMLYDGVTGIPVNNDKYKDILRLSRSMEDTYVFAGFGISTNERAKELIDSGFHGVIIGTAIVKMVKQSVKTMSDFVREMKNAIRDKRREYILAADLGTTAVKVSLVNGMNEVTAEKSREITTEYTDEGIEQDPLEWYREFCQSVRELLQEHPVEEDIAGISFSGQMQDLILIPRAGETQRQPKAILYSDARASVQAERILAEIGEEEISRVTGNHFDGSMPFAKLAWVREHRKEELETAEKIVFSSKDYVIYRLTGAFVTDVTTASTSGLMDIHKKEWAASWMAAEGLDVSLLPRLCYPSETAGELTETAAKECGLPAGIRVYAGIGDAGATTLASGLVRDGEYNINLGTSGWVAQVSNEISKEDGVFHLAYVTPDTYINVTPFYNAGNVHKWVSRMLTKDEEQENKYSYLNQVLEGSTPGSHGTLFLPYLNGERYPVSDSETRGAYIGITAETTKQDMARASLEGVAFSLKGGFVSEIESLSLIGGGARVPAWCQIFADTMDHEVKVFRNPDYMPTIAVAVTAQAEKNAGEVYGNFLTELDQSGECERFLPDPEAVKVMEAQYQRFQRVYPAVKQI
ncbi:MAG: tryptophan synthase subunit alpha [Eubacteriales bacterium]|nr:tryptophan synthase subunit alpha [Eubacteriales bacterium]